MDATVLEPAGEPEFRPASSALGAGGTVTARFVAVGAGQTTLTLNYARPFERDVPPLKTFTVSVLVTTSSPAAASRRRPAPRLGGEAHCRWMQSSSTRS